MTGGYGTPIQETCNFCRGKLTHKCMVNPVQISRDESLDAFGVYLEERDLWVYLCDPCFGKVFAERSKGYKRGGSLVERLEREIESRKAATGRCWPAPERRSRDPLVVLLQDALDQIRRQ